ncbi:MAG: DUF89 family protein [Gammaproteobacteria bacterium]|nr:DUF89 family protein [Gammaproteobacteria bacterium]
MKTHLDCIPCFFKQALVAARHAGANAKQQKEILDNLAKLIPSFSLSTTPPEMAKSVYALVNEAMGTKDIYATIKYNSNQLALNIAENLQTKITNSKDSLLTAVELAIAGNIIDYGAKMNLNVDTEIAKILSEENKSIKKSKSLHFDYTEFKNNLVKAKNILYLADNAGEVVFDRLLITEIKRLYPKIKITYAVKSKPIINDALLEDAIQCGIDKVATIISSGSDAAGTVLKLCSQEFLTLFNKADMVISKGQGNFEALSEAKRSIAFLFKIKCPVIAKEINSKLGDVILLYNNQIAY